MLNSSRVFDSNPLTQQLALAVNLFPGVAAQLTQRGAIGYGGGWIESLHDPTCREVTQAFHNLGFQSLGPLSCKWMPGWVLRGFSHPQADAWAVHYVGIVFGSQVDFVTEFSDGSWTTTTTHACVSSSDPVRKAIRTVRGLPLREVWQSHQAAVQERDAPTMITGGQRELAESIRRYFRRGVVSS
jgi:hypothetical protein